MTNVQPESYSMEKKGKDIFKIRNRIKKPIHATFIQLYYCKHLPQETTRKIEKKTHKRNLNWKGKSKTVTDNRRKYIQSSKNVTK